MSYTCSNGHKFKKEPTWCYICRQGCVKIGGWG